MRRFYECFEIDQTPSDLFTAEIDQTPSNELPEDGIQQALPARSVRSDILQTVSGLSSERLSIEFRKHFTLGWSHYRLLLGQADALKRRFYFEQAAQQRWSVRELRRQMESALFERVALSRDTRKLTAILLPSAAALLGGDQPETWHVHRRR
jgi:hypothetical protein